MLKPFASPNVSVSDFNWRQSVTLCVYVSSCIFRYTSCARRFTYCTFQIRALTLSYIAYTNHELCCRLLQFSNTNDLSTAHQQKSYTKRLMTVHTSILALLSYDITLRSVHKHWSCSWHSVTLKGCTVPLIDGLLSRKPSSTYCTVVNYWFFVEHPPWIWLVKQHGASRP